MRVIAVDDEEIALKNIELRLRECPEVSEFFMFSTPQDALEWLHCNTADAALLDISMRRMNGLALAKEMRELAPGCAIIFATGYSEYAVEAFALKASGYLLKPIETADLHRELSYVLQQKPPDTAPKKRVRLKTSAISRPLRTRRR